MPLFSRKALRRRRSSLARRFLLLLRPCNSIASILPMALSRAAHQFIRPSPSARLIVLPTGYACAREAPPQGAVANALHALTLLTTRQVLSELEHLEGGIEYHVVPPLCPLLGSPYDFSHTTELIKRATESTDAWLAEGGLERREIPNQMRPHTHSSIRKIGRGQ
jgi:hypothetical protein